MGHGTKKFGNIEEKLILERTKKDSRIAAKLGFFSKYSNDQIIVSLVWFGMVWYGLVWLERTCKTSNVDFHMFWTQVRQSSILRSFQGGGGCQGVPPPL